MHLAQIPSSAVQVQHTLAQPAACAGVGVHTGLRIGARLLPAAAGTGIQFVRTDVTDRDNVVPVDVSRVTDTALGTVLRNAAGVEVSTVEHLLAACMGMGVDNLRVEIDGPEAPILDGSAAVFTQIIEAAGLLAQGAARRVIRIRQTIEVRDGAKWASLAPVAHDGFEADVRIHFDDPAIGIQRRALRIDRDSFVTEIADARTFGFKRDAERLHAMGKGRGASFDNTVVLDEGRILNAGGLRHEDELVRHKILDCIGDLALLGAPIVGRLEANQPGHTLNVALVRAVLAQPDRWQGEEGREAAFAVAPAIRAAGL